MNFGVTLTDRRADRKLGSDHEQCASWLSGVFLPSTGLWSLGECVYRGGIRQATAAAGMRAGRHSTALWSGGHFSTAFNEIVPSPSYGCLPRRNRRNWVCASPAFLGSGVVHVHSLPSRIIIDTVHLVPGSSLFLTTFNLHGWTGRC